MVAPWHVRRSKEFRLANLGGVSSKELVRERGLSSGAFLAAASGARWERRRTRRFVKQPIALFKAA